MRQSLLFLSVIALASCQGEKAIYENASYSMYADRIV